MKHIFTCIECGVEWSVYPHEAKQNSKCSSCKERNLQMDKNIVTYAVCHYCWQKQEVGIYSKSYSCIFCHSPNKNPFYVEERIEDMDQPRDPKTGRFVKVDMKKQIEDQRSAEKQRPQTKGFWEVDEVVKEDCITECSKVQKSVDILIEPIVKKKVNYLMDKFRNLEWLAYLLGEKQEENDGTISFLIYDIIIPKQKVSATLVYDIECENYNTLPIVGVMHSHHNMGANFSGQDHDTVNQNHDVSLLVSHKSTAGQVRVPTPCGGYKIIDNVNIKHLPNNEMDENFVKEVEENISSGNPQFNKKKQIAKKQMALTDSQKSYSNGQSVKEYRVTDKRVVKNPNDYWDSEFFVACPECHGLNDNDALRCEFCQAELPA